MSLFDLSFAVGLLATHDVTIKHYSPGTYDTQGRALARTSTTVTARGSVQPAKGQDIARLPEGVASGDVVALYITAQVLIADEIVIGSARYQVQHIDEWNAAGNYTRAVGMLLNPREV